MTERPALGWLRASELLSLFCEVGATSPVRVLSVVRRNAAAGHLRTAAFGLRYQDALKQVSKKWPSGLLPREVWQDESVTIDWLTGDLSGATPLQRWQADGVQFHEGDLLSILGLDARKPGEPRKAHRPAGSGQFVTSDKVHVEHMRELRTTAGFTSIDAAAREQWPDCGGASLEAAVKRLRRKYLEKYGRT